MQQRLKKARVSGVGGARYEMKLERDPGPSHVEFVDRVQVLVLNTSRVWEATKIM